MNYNFTSPYGAGAIDPSAASSNWIKQFAANTANVATASPGASPTIAGNVGSLVAGAAGNATNGLTNSGNPTGLAGKLQTAGSAMDILGGLAQIYFGFQQQKLAKQQFGFQKQAFNSNLRNSVQSYNTALGDRIRARHFTEGKSNNDTADYIKSNSLTTSGV